jgi:hypothetical protein
MSLNIACTAAEVPASTRPTGASVTWPRYANPTDIETVPLQARRLPGSTYGAPPPDDDWCGQRDGRITRTRPAPAGESQRAAVASLLDRYAITGELT